MLFNMFTWIFFGLTIAGFVLWAASDEHRVHWFETLLVGGASAFAGGLLADQFRMRGHGHDLWVGNFDVISLIAAVVASSAALALYWFERYFAARHRRLQRR